MTENKVRDIQVLWTIFLKGFSQALKEGVLNFVIPFLNFLNFKLFNLKARNFQKCQEFLYEEVLGMTFCKCHP